MVLILKNTLPMQFFYVVKKVVYFPNAQILISLSSSMFEVQKSFEKSIFNNIIAQIYTST